MQTILFEEFRSSLCIRQPLDSTEREVRVHVCLRMRITEGRYRSAGSDEQRAPDAHWSLGCANFWPLFFFLAESEFFYQFIVAISESFLPNMFQDLILRSRVVPVSGTSRREVGYSRDVPDLVVNTTNLLLHFQFLFG